MGMKWCWWKRNCVCVKLVLMNLIELMKQLNNHDNWKTLNETFSPSITMTISVYSIWYIWFCAIILWVCMSATSTTDWMCIIYYMREAFRFHLAYAECDLIL